MWLLATGNLHKVREIGEVLRPLGIDLIRPADLGLTLDPEEWGATFAENAVIKALAFATETGRVCLADDSGLEVDALGGAPGVYSARYAGTPSNDAANNAKLIDALDRVSAADRSARYRCVIAGVWPAGTWPPGAVEAPERPIEGAPANGAIVVDGALVCTFDGACEGHIARDPAGDGGFGYDPYFVVPDGRHMAELPSDEKHAMSHRGAALRKLHAWLLAHPELHP